MLLLVSVVVDILKSKYFTERVCQLEYAVLAPYFLETLNSFDAEFLHHRHPRNTDYIKIFVVADNDNDVRIILDFAETYWLAREHAGI